MPQRDLLYPGITRGRRLGVRVGRRRAVASAIKTDKVEARFTVPAERLRDMLDALAAHRLCARSPESAGTPRRV